MPRTDGLLLGIDQGTSSTKAMLVDSDRAVVSRASVDVLSGYPMPGWAEQSAHDIWASVQRVVSACVPAGLAGQVIGIGLSTQRESLVLWDRATGEPCGPMVSWQDRRTADACRQLAGTGVGQDVRARSGLPLDPMFSALKARWLLDTYDPGRTRSERGELCLGTVEAWLLSRLDGGHRTEVGNASRTQLFDLSTGGWSDELLDLFDVPARVLPEVVASTGPFPATRGLAPLPDGVPVLAVLGDSHAALFAHAGWRPGVVKATYGTGSSVMAIGDAPGNEGICRTIAWDIGAGPVPAVEGNIRSAGRTLSWLAELFGISIEQVAEEAATSSSDGVHLVPAFGGLGAPWWEPDAVTVIEGATLGTRRGNLAAAAIDSVAFQVEDVASAVEAVIGAVPMLLADGAMTRNDHLMQRQADVGGRCVARGSETELSALGAVALAGVQAGIWSLDDLASTLPDREEFRPRMSAGEAAGRRAAWRAAVTRSLSPSIAMRASEASRDEGRTM